MEGIQIDVGGSAFPVQIRVETPADFEPSIGGPPNSSPETPPEDGGNGRSHAMKMVIGVLVELAVGGGITFQTASALPKPFLMAYVAISLVLAVLDIALLVLLCRSGGEPLTRFAKRGAVVMMVLALLLPAILKLISLVVKFL